METIEETTEETRYIYSGASNSIQAAIHTPFKSFLSDPPSAALQVIGGHISQVKENINFHEIVKIGRASATVLGERRGSNYFTFATATVEKLNIHDMITADAIVCRVTSVYPVGGYSKREAGSMMHPATFYLAGSHFDNLKIDGKPYTITIEDTFSGNGGFQGRSDEVMHRSIFGDRSNPSTPQPIVSVTVPQFGTTYLGEMDYFGSRLSLTMFRAELGSPFGGRIGGPTAATNGHDGP